MTELERKALLGDQQAQEECTRLGIVLPCPCCGGESELRHSSTPTDFSEIIDIFFVICKKCGCKPFEFSDMNLFFTKKGVKNAEQLKIKTISAWNTRPAPPIGRCGECSHFHYNLECDTYCSHREGLLDPEEDDFCRYFKPKGGKENG